MNPSPATVASAARPIEVTVRFSDKSFVTFGPRDPFGGHLFTSPAAAERFVRERYASMAPTYTIEFR